MDLSKLNKELEWKLRCDCGATMPLPSCVPVLAKDMMRDLRELLDAESVAIVARTVYGPDEMPMVGGVNLPPKWLIEHHQHELWMVCDEANWEGIVKRRHRDVRNRPGQILTPKTERPGASGLIVLPGGKR